LTSACMLNYTETSDRLNMFRGKGNVKMGTIYFVSDLEQLAVMAIKNAHDCADIDNDLSRILNTIRYGTERDANVLDAELRWKYPAINAMQQVANSLPGLPCRRTAGIRGGSSNKENLRIDYWGILCDTAIKKGLKRNFEECIDHIEE